MAMRRLLGIFFNLLTLFFILLLVGVGALLFIVDPDRYRRPLQELVLRETGIQLQIAGDMSLALQPAVGIILSDLRLLDTGSARELGSAALVRAGIDPWQLVRGRLVLQDLAVSNLHVNWYTDQDGRNAWRENLRPAETGAFSGDSPVQNLIRQVTLSKTTIDVQDHSRNRHFSLRNLSLTGRSSNSVDQAVRVRSEFDFSAEDGRMPNHLVVSSLNRLDLANGDISVEELEITFTPMLLRGDLEIRDLFSNSSWSGKLVSNSFPFRALLENAGVKTNTSAFEPIATTAIEPASAMSLQVTFSGDSQQLRISSASMSLGDMTASGDAVIRYQDPFTPAQVSFRMTTGALDLSPYMDSNEPPADPFVAPGPLTPSTPPAPVTKRFTVQPQWLAGKTVQGTAVMESLRLGSLQAGPLTLFTNLEDGVLDLELTPRSEPGNEAGVSLRIDSRGAELNLELAANSLNRDFDSTLLPMLAPGAIQGRLFLQSRLQSSGNSVADWLDNVSGYAGFRIDDSLVDIGVIKQVFTAITTLSPTVEPVGQWPDPTRFTGLGGFLVFKEGLRAGQEFRVRMDNLDLQGIGGLDLSQGTFQYDMAFSVLGEPLVQAVALNPLYQNQPWPVQCAGSFDTEPGQICRPDFQRVRERYVNISAGLVSSGTEDVLMPQFPVQLPQQLWALLPGVIDPTALVPAPPEAVVPLPGPPLPEERL